MAYCRNCGREISEGAAFCPACGAAAQPPQPGAATAPPQGAAAPPPTPPAPPPPPGTQPPLAQYPAGAPPAHVPGVVPPPPARKKMASGWKALLIIGVSIIVVIAVGAVLLGVFVFKAVKAPVDVTNRYIEAVNEGDASAAWELLHPSSRFKRDYTLSTFESQVIEPTTRLKTWNAHEVEVKNDRADVKVDMEDVEGSEFRVIFQLRKDGSDWKVFDYNLD